jgi:DNA topoisomerase-3
MKVILAEKPSVARDIAKCLGVTQRKDGYIEGNGYQVTWAFGHLVELKEPDEYFPEWKRWTLETLPIIPEKFQLRARGEDSAKKQLNTIKTLFKGADEIICATDAGREGELIFRYILSWSQCLRKPVKRLWINSLTDQAIHQGFENLKDSKRYDNLYRAAQCRSESDWIVGLNATRLYTLSYGQNRRLWSIGRVQTPVLAMIVHRDLAIRDFVAHDFWELATRYRETTFKWAGARFDTRAKAQERLDKTLGQPLRISRVQAKAEKLLPPLYYDLTKMQKDMSKRFGFTADQTLSTAQQLYEKKHLTYPRTDSRYLTDDMKAEIKPLLSALGRIKPTEVGKIDLAALTFSKRFFDASKVTDHHAIIPTPVLAGSALSADEAKVYDAVVVRFLASFYPPCLKELTTVVGISAGEEFRTTGTVIKEPGWQTLYSGAQIEEKDEDDNQILPVFIVDESGPHAPFVKAGKTTPPKHFTEGTLLAMMETAGKQCDDDALKEALKNKGLGTPATRAAIIETLITRQYIHRVKKAIVATDSGRHLISLIPDERLKSADLTGEWESKLKRMENGDYDPDLFMQEIADFTRQLKLSAAQPNIDVSQLGHCPRCGQAVIEGKKGYGCSAWKTGCNFTVMKDLYGLSLSKAMLQELLQNRHTALSYPVTVNGEIFDAQLRLEKDGTITPVKLAASPARATAKEALMPCPLCRGQVTEQAKSYSCSEWQNGCPLVIWKTIAGKAITVAMAKKLIKRGETGLLKGFVSKAGKAFEANLKLVKGKVEMDFNASPNKKRSV